MTLGFWSKLVTQRAPEIISSHRYTETTVTYTISSESNPENSWVTHKHQANERKTTSKLVRKAEIHSRYKLHTQHSNIQWGRKHNCQHLREESRFWTQHLVCQVWKLAPNRQGSKTTYPESQWGHASMRPTTLTKQRSSLNWLVRTHTGYSLRSQCRGSRNTHLPAFPWKRA